MKKQPELFERPPEVTLNAYKPLARTYYIGDPHELVTEPDVSPSLRHMVETGQVAGLSNRYQFGENEDDDHHLPDLQRLSQADVIIKTNYINHLNKPKDEESDADAEDTQIPEQGKNDESVTDEESRA